MKKVVLLLFMFAISASFISAQSTTPIEAKNKAVFTVPSQGDVADSLLPYYKDLGVRRVIVADANGDGEQEILATDYSNGGRVHVMKIVQDSLLEIIWSSPASENSSGSTPRFIQVGDCDGDGNLEIIFPQRYFPNPVDDSEGRIAIYEWNGTDWGTEPAFSITPPMLETAGGREGLRFHREYLTVYDFDGDGRTEIIVHGDAPRQDVLILGTTFEYPGFASIYIEGGKPGEQTNGGDWGAGGSFWNAIPADIDGDGKLEIVNHTYNNYGLWSIEVNGFDDYTYPEATDNADAKAKGVYHEYTPVDAVSYFGVQAVDVNGDGKDEIVGTQYGNGHTLAMISFPETATDNYIWTDASQTENYRELFTSGEIAALAGNTVAELWPVVKGDVNQDGMDEIYTGGGNGLNLVAIQYKGIGDLLDPASYDMNLVYNGEGGEVFATYEIYQGRISQSIDSTYIGDSLVVDTTDIAFDPTVIDTVKKEVPFTSYIFADSVDLDNDGKLEIVLAEQSVYDSIDVIFKVVEWNDSTNYNLGYRWVNSDESYKIFNDYRQTVRVLEYEGPTVGFKEQLYGIITPDDYKLEQNYPNPFNPTTTINFSLPIDKKISLKVYDMVGQEIKTLLNNSQMKKGSHEIIWNGTNNFGSKVASGNYIAKFTFGNFTKSIKMTLLK